MADIELFAGVTGSVATMARMNEIITAVNALTTSGASTESIATVLHPEWPGVVWLQSGSLPDADRDSAAGRNHYALEAATGTETATGQIRVTLPLAFSDWDSTTPLRVAIRTTDTSGDASVSVTPYRNATAMTAKTALVSTVSDAWRVVTWSAAEIGAGSWVAGDTLTLQIVLEATTTVLAYVGEVAMLWTEER